MPATTNSDINEFITCPALARGINFKYLFIRKLISASELVANFHPALFMGL